MKKVITALVSLAMVAGLASCQKPANYTPVTGNVTLSFGFEDTKVSYTEVGNNLHPEWEVGDIIVGQTKDGSNSFSLTVTAVSGGSATVTGDAPLDAEVCLLYKKGLSSIGSQPVTVGYSNQSGDKAMPAVMLSGGEIKGGKGNFRFSGAGAVIGIDNAKGASVGTTITGVTVIGENLSEGEVKNEGGVFTLTARTKQWDIISTGTLSGITVTDNDGKLSRPIFIAVPVGAKVAKVTLSANGGDSYFTYKLSSEREVSANSYLYVKEQQTFVKTPDGALPGEFSVSATKKVYFSKGNLTYNVLTKTWVFYEHQYDYASGYDANLISLFTWGYNSETSIIPNGIRYVEGHTTGYETFSESEDWGYVFGGESSVWRTLSIVEWQYLFGTSAERSGKYKCGVTICDKTNCVVIAPDDWDISANPLQMNYDSSTWPVVEASGLVCLPAAGDRNGSSVLRVNNFGQYRSSSASSWNGAYYVGISRDAVFPYQKDYRSYGYSVRLVAEVK